MSNKTEFARVIAVDMNSNDVAQSLGIPKERRSEIEVYVASKLYDLSSPAMISKKFVMGEFIEEVASIATNTNELAYVMFTFGITSVIANQQQQLQIQMNRFNGLLK